MVGQHVVAPIDAPGPLRTDPDNRKVGGAAADIGDQHDLLVDHRPLVCKRSRDRFILKLHLGKTDPSRRRFERGLRLRVAQRIVVDKADRPPQHHPIDGGTGASFGAALQMQQIAGDHVEIFDTAAATGIGGLVDQCRAENALHRSHQPAIEAIDIRCNCGSAEGPRRPVKVAAFDKIEHRGRHRRVAGFKLDQLH